MAMIEAALPGPVGQAPSGQSQADGLDGMAMRLFCTAFGTALAMLGDLTRNGNAAVLLKLREVLKTNVFAQFEATYLVMLLVMAIAIALAVVWPPRNRTDAFAKGLAIFALLTTATPFADVPASTDLRLSAATPSSLSALFISQAVAAPPAEAFRKPVVIVFDGTPAPGARALVRNAETGAVLGQRELDGARTEMAITAPRGLYDVDVEAPGFARSRARVAINGPGERASVIQVQRSAVPLAIQQLYAPNAAKVR